MRNLLTRRALLGLGLVPAVAPLLGNRASALSPRAVYDIVLDYGADPSGTQDSTAAIQAAIDDASEGRFVTGLGWFGGGIVFAPPGNYLLSSSGSQCLRIGGKSPIILRGSGYLNTIFMVGSSVGSLTDCLRIAGSTIALQGIVLEDFRISAQSGLPGRNALTIDTTEYLLARLMVRRVYFGPLGGSGIISLNPTLLDGFYQSTITDSVVYNGITLRRAGDSMTIERNTLAGRNIGVDASFVPGASLPIIRGNNITTSGGGVRLGVVSAPRIEDNFIEGHVGDAGSHGASIDLDGDAAGPCSDALVTGNLVVPIDPLLSCVRVNRSTRANIHDNTLIRPGPPPSAEIVVTSNASWTHIGHNTYQPDGDSLAVNGLRDAGSNTSF